MLGFTAIFAAVVLMRMRAELARTKAEARLRRSGGRMNPWPFVIAAYALTVARRPLALVAWAWRSMRTAEADADALKRDP